MLMKLNLGGFEAFGWCGLCHKVSLGSSTGFLYCFLRTWFAKIRKLDLEQRKVANTYKFDIFSEKCKNVWTMA